MALAVVVVGLERQALLGDAPMSAGWGYDISSLVPVQPHPPLEAYGAPMGNQLSERHADLLTGSYDCVDRVVLNAYFSLGHSPGGFRTWWRRLHDNSDQHLDNAHLMSTAERFSRRVRGWARPTTCRSSTAIAGSAKHLIAEECLAAHPRARPGVFLILVARASATSWDVQRSKRGVIREDLAQVADTLSHDAAIGRLGQVCDRWIYTACLCFGLDLADQERSAFRYSYAIYQVEYSRNLLFGSGAQMDTVFEAIVHRTRSRLTVPVLRTLFGAHRRPRTNRSDLSPRLAAVIETPQYGLTIFKVHFGALTVKGYTKGEHVLRFEAVAHNTKALGVGRVLDRFPDIVARLAGMLERFCTTLDCVDVAFIPYGILDELPQPSLLGPTRVGGIDLNNPRTRTTLAASSRSPPLPMGSPSPTSPPSPRRQRPGRLHGPSSRLRPAQTPRPHPHHQTWTRPPLPRPTGRGRHHHRPAHAARTSHRPHRRRRPQPPTRTQTRPLDRRRPRLRVPPHRPAKPLPRPRPHHRGRIDNTLLIRGSKRLDGLPVAEEFVVLVVAAVAATDLGVVGDELDTFDPLDLFETELDLVAEP
jgi:hypothetical protein